MLREGLQVGVQMGLRDVLSRCRWQTPCSTACAPSASATHTEDKIGCVNAAERNFDLLATVPAGLTASAPSENCSPERLRWKRKDLVLTTAMSTNCAQATVQSASVLFT